MPWHLALNPNGQRTSASHEAMGASGHLAPQISQICSACLCSSHLLLMRLSICPGEASWHHLPCLSNLGELLQGLCFSTCHPENRPHNTAPVAGAKRAERTQSGRRRGREDKPTLSHSSLDSTQLSGTNQTPILFPIWVRLFKGPPIWWIPLWLPFKTTKKGTPISPTLTVYCFLRSPPAM